MNWSQASVSCLLEYSTAYEVDNPWCIALVNSFILKCITMLRALIVRNDVSGTGILLQVNNNPCLWKYVETKTTRDGYVKTYWSILKGNCLDIWGSRIHSAGRFVRVEALKLQRQISRTWY